MKNGGDKLIEIIGLDANSTKVRNVLADWGVYPNKESAEGVTFTGTQCGAWNDIVENCAILVKVSAKKIDELIVWGAWDFTIDLQMPYGLSRNDDIEKVRKTLISNGYIIQDGEKIQAGVDNTRKVYAYTLIDNRYILFYCEYCKDKPIIERYSLDLVRKKNPKDIYNELNKKNQEKAEIKVNTSKMTAKLRDITKYIIEELEEDDLIYPYYMVIDWKEYDKDIIELCEDLLKTNKLKAEEVDVPLDKSPLGVELYIHYKGKKTKVEFEETPYRSTTINTLNKVISDKYEIRFVLESDGSDTLYFLPLSKEEWKILEENIGKEKLSEYFEYTEEILF